MLHILCYLYNCSAKDAKTDQIESGEVDQKDTFSSRWIKDEELAELKNFQ